MVSIISKYCKLYLEIIPKYSVLYKGTSRGTVTNYSDPS